MNSILQAKSGKTIITVQGWLHTFDRSKYFNKRAGLMNGLVAKLWWQMCFCGGKKQLMGWVMRGCTIQLKIHSNVQYCGNLNITVINVCNGCRSLQSRFSHLVKSFVCHSEFTALSSASFLSLLRRRDCPVSSDSSKQWTLFLAVLMEGLIITVCGKLPFYFMLQELQNVNMDESHGTKK